MADFGEKFSAALAEIEHLETEATEYSIGYNIDEDAVSIAFHNGDFVLSNFVTDAAGAYEFAQRLLRAYDKVEGL